MSIQIEKNKYHFNPSSKYLFVNRNSYFHGIDGRKTVYIFQKSSSNYYIFQLVSITFPGEDPYFFSNLEVIPEDILNLYHITEIPDYNISEVHECLYIIG